MYRRLKQLIYGLFYLLVFTGISVGIYFYYLIPKPTCFDNIKNQNEENADCGGLCVSCELKTLNLINGEVQVFSAGKFKSTILVKIKNPSSNYFLRKFGYKFDVFSKLGTRLAAIEGKSSVLPVETKYLVVPGINYDYQDILKVVFKTLDQNWEPAGNSPRYSFKTENLKTEVSGGYIQVKGELVNDSAFSASSIVVAAIIYGKSGDILNGSTGEINSVAAFSKNPFKIYLPALAYSVNNFDSVKTEVFYEVIEN